VVFKIIIVIIIIIIIIKYCNGIFLQNNGKTCTALNILLCYQKRDDKNDNNGDEGHDAVEQLKESEYYW
jgi:uncharacterized protein YxeA